MSVLSPKKLMTNTMSLLKEWPPADDALPLHQSHLIVTFALPISQEFQSSRMQEHFERMTSLEGWSIYTPVGGPQEKMSFLQIASGPILSIPFHLKVCQYGPCKVSLKKMTPSLPTTPPKSAFFWHY